MPAPQLHQPGLPESTLAPPLVDTPRFLLATRDTGYRSIAAALAELIDNSLQAGAGRIRVMLERGRDGADVPTVSVLDDGVGMSQADLRCALQFGGSRRFGERSGLGRFGMGLPNSSLSQARRVDVYSWTTPGDVRHSSLDLDAVLAGEPPSFAGAVGVLPDQVHGMVGESGTLVVWSRCDRLAKRQIGRLAGSLREELGRIYRYALWDGVAITVNGDAVSPRDPLFLRAAGDGVNARAYGSTLRYEVRVPGGEQTSLIQVRFSELPVVEWKDRPSADRRSSGIVRGAGVSVIRAGREIDYGWTLLGDKRRENYDDWWRCEIAFDPPLDELFGVTHSKQGVHPTPELRALIEPDLESVARTLNRRVRGAFGVSDVARPSRAEKRAERREATLPFGEPSHGSAPDRAVNRYRITTRDMASGDFFCVEHADGVRLLVLNRLHPFYDRVYRPLAVVDAPRFALDCILLGAARALDTGLESHGPDCAGTLLARWSDALAAYLT